MKFKFYFVFVLLWSCNLNAQSTNLSVISSAGGTYKSNNLQLDWTIGELLTNTLNGSHLRITEGFHQPEYSVTSIGEISHKIKANIYPNPYSDILNIEVDLEKSEEVVLKLFDSSGKLLWHKNFSGVKIKETKNLSPLPVGNYFLSFMINENQTTETFKIQKTK